jgi:hypothetical protein
MTMTEAGTSTDIEVVTDLAITGKPAQFGRGVMQDVSDKLLGQFVACLEQRFEGSGAAEADVPEVAAVAEVPEVPADPVPPAAEPDATLTDEAAPAAVEVPPPAPAAVAAPTPAAPAAAVPGKRKKDDDALNLGTTVVPILFKSYWKQALAALVVLAIIIWLITRL